MEVMNMVDLVLIDILCYAQDVRIVRGMGQGGCMDYEKRGSELS